MPDSTWAATLSRVRSEFEEMPCLRVTAGQARLLFGLSGTAADWVLGWLAREGFLDRTNEGEYVRKSAAP